MIGKYVLAALLTLGLASPSLAAGSSSTSTPKKSVSTFDIAEKAVKAGDYKRAIPILKQVVALNPRDADAWNYLGFSHRNLKRFDAAFAAYEKALAINPNHLGANEYLGELYLQTEDLAKAQVQLEKLDGLCTSGCQEFDDLRQAIKVYAENRKKG